MVPVQALPVLVLYLAHRRPKCRSHIGAHRELDHLETLVLPLGAVLQQLLLISGAVRTHEHLLHPCRQHLQRFFEHAQLLMARRHIAVAKLRVQHLLLLRPPDIQRLIRPHSLVAKQRLALAALDQRRIHIQCRRGAGPALLRVAHQIRIHPPQPQQRTARCRDRRFAHLRHVPRCFESRQIPKHRRG